MQRTIIVQNIHTVWTKQSRGGPDAVRRNAIPEALKVPLRPQRKDDPVFIQHQVGYGEIDKFSRPFERLIEDTTLKPLQVGCVIIDYSEDIVFASFRYTQGCGGAPDRGWMRKTMHLSLNEWGQFVYNGRFSLGYDSYWQYEKMVVNVGLFETALRGVFTRNAPACRYEAMGHLF